MKRAAFTALPLSLCLAACGAPDEGLEKAPGGEEQALTDSKADSFFRPTEHGDIAFGAPSSGRLGDSASFHAWTFQLADDAQVKIETASSDRNLDTVMYLYRWQPERETWGRYIEKNDDLSSKSLQSRIEAELGVGRYRIIVKGLKRATAGRFTVQVDCEGAGCDLPGDDVTITVPEDTRYTEGCAGRLYDVLGGEVIYRAEDFATLSDAARLSPEAYQAALWYGAEHMDYLSPEELEEVELEITTTALADGFIVEVTEGADYSMQYVFTDHTLIMSYFNDQTPWPTFYCADEAEAEVTEPDEWCAGGLISTLPRAAGEEVAGPEGAQESAEAVMDLPAAVAHSLDLYRAAEGVAADKPVTWSTTTWGDEWVKGWAVQAEAEGAAPATYVVQDDGRPMALLRVSADEIETICK